MPTKIFGNDWDSGHVAEQVIEQEFDKYSKLLGPDGKPLKYEKIKLGFDLSKRKKDEI